MRGVTVPVFDSINKEAISIHTPHARRDVTLYIPNSYTIQFQSTRLMRGVTLKILHAAFTPYIISIHTPHARRDLYIVL